MIMRRYIGKIMINKLQNFMKWASEQVFKTNPPKEQHLDHVQVIEKPVKVRKPKVKKEATNANNS